MLTNCRKPVKGGGLSAVFNIADSGLRGSDGFRQLFLLFSTRFSEFL